MGGNIKEIMSDFNFVTKYAQTKPNGEKETWIEANNRIWNMHNVRYEKILNSENGKKLRDLMNFAKQMEDGKAVLSAQRVRQFADPDPSRGILRHNGKLYNCASAYMDDVERFSQTMFSLLEGSGVGLSIQFEHINSLPVFYANSNNYLQEWTIDDSIEGWADAIDVLIRSYLKDSEVRYKFDYTKIRPKGALIAGQFIAPGPDGLRNSINHIIDILDNATKSGQRKLYSIEIYDIIMWIADSVLSGGVRRSATIMLFSPDDELMLNAKTGNWRTENPQRKLSNNSVMFNRNTVTKDQFDHAFKSVKEFGEPGFCFTNSIHTTVNPCVEIGKTPILLDTMETGFQYCNLSEINGSYCSTEERLMKAVKAATIIGTLQAGYTNFDYLGDVTKKIVEKEALLGVSITGWMANPKILFDNEIISKAARYAVEVNKEVAKLIGINQAARVTTTKPSGNASVLLMTPSGIHGDHSERYIRNMQINKTEVGCSVMEEQNPNAIADSVWSNTDRIISFPLRASKGSLLKEDLLGVKQLEYVRKAQKNWVLNGMTDELSTVSGTTHNVSNTIQVPDDEWEDVREYIWHNHNIFSGVSLLSVYGELDYPQAPFQKVKNEKQIVSEYGSGAIFASGLIVDTENVFKSIWDATDCVKNKEDLTIIEDRENIVTTKYYRNLNDDGLSIVEFSKYYWSNIHKPEDTYSDFEKLRDETFKVTVKEYVETIEGDNLETRILKNKKADWVRRFKKFSKNYFDGNETLTINCLKDVQLLHSWTKLRKSMKPINWEGVNFSSEYKNSADNVATACAGGNCEVTF